MVTHSANTLGNYNLCLSTVQLFYSVTVLSFLTPINRFSTTFNSSLSSVILSDLSKGDLYPVATVTLL